MHVKGVSKLDKYRFRSSLVWMWCCGMSVDEISIKKHVSKATVYRWIRRWQNEGNVMTKTRSRLVSPEIHREKPISDFKVELTKK